MAGWIPASDSLFSEWLANFTSYLNTHYAEYGITSDELNRLQDILGPEWTAAQAANVTAHATAKGTTAAKNAARRAVEDYVKFLAEKIREYPDVTKAALQEFGLVPPAADTSGTIPGSSDDKPLATVDISNRLKHTFKIQNQTASGVRSGKPAGALGAEIWAKFGEAPSGPSDTQLVGIATRSSFVLEFSDDKAGKQAYYMMRWITSKGEAGSWSETLSATIAA